VSESLEIMKFLLSKKTSFRKRLDTIKSVENIIENIAMLCELLWVVMQLDLERLKNRADNTEEINVQAQDCAKRMVRLIFVLLNFNLNYFI
jgi:hypothetical protein